MFSYIYMHYILSLLNFFVQIMTINGKENHKDRNQNQDKLKCEVTDLHVDILIQIFLNRLITMS